MTRAPGISVEILDDGSLKLQEDLHFEITDLCGIEIRVCVPNGFVSDGASLPRILWPILGAPIQGDHLRASLFHDWWCVQARTGAERRLGDSLFFYQLQQAEISRVKRFALWAGVRLYALLFWKPV